jgi:hypothetical protein
MVFQNRRWVNCSRLGFFLDSGMSVISPVYDMTFCACADTVLSPLVAVVVCHSDIILQISVKLGIADI